MAYLLVSWDADNSVSVISRKAKAILSLDGNRIRFRWPRKGVYDGNIINSSDVKRDMDKQAQEMAENEETIATKAKSDESNLPRDQAVILERKRKRKLVPKMTAQNYEVETATSDEDEEGNLQVQVSLPKHHKKGKSLGLKKDSSSTQCSKKHHKKNDDKAALLAASNASAQLLFSQSAYVKSMQEEIKKLQQQLRFQEYKRGLDKHQDRDLELSDSDDTNNFKEVPTRKHEEKRQENGLRTEEPAGTKDMIVTEKREKGKISKVELIKGMGVIIKGASLASALTQSKRQPTRLLRFLMGEMFTEDEMRCSTMRGKKSSLPPLDQGTMNAILCFTIAKGEEWGQPISEEALVRQANEKCYQYRRAK